MVLSENAEATQNANLCTSNYCIYLVIVIMPILMELTCQYCPRFVIMSFHVIDIDFNHVYIFTECHFIMSVLSLMPYVS